MILNGQLIRDVGGIELSGTSDNPNFAVSLRRSTSIADAAKEKAIQEAMSRLETQRFINAFKAANEYPNYPSVYYF